MIIPTKALVLAGLLVVAPVAVFADSDDPPSDDAPTGGCTSAAGVADSSGATSWNDAVGELLPSGSSAVDDVTADEELETPVTILVPTNIALDRNTTRGLARSGDLVNVIETHVIQGTIDKGSVQDGDTATTVSGETLVFSVQDGTVTATVDGGADSVTLGDKQESCAGPVYIVDKPLRPKALAPAMAPIIVPAPEPEMAPAPVPEVEEPEVAPAPLDMAPRVLILPPMEEPEVAPEIAPEIVMAPAPEIIAPEIVPEIAPEVVPEVAPEIAPVVEPLIAPEIVPLIVPIFPAIAPVVAPIAAAPRDFVLPVIEAPTPGPAAPCMTLADKLGQISPALLEASAALPEQVLAELTNPDANITILVPPDEDLAALAGQDPALVEDILLVHVLPERYTAEEFVEEGDGNDIETSNAVETLELDLSDGVAFVLGNITATVTEADIDACAPDSIIHRISEALIPASVVLDRDQVALPPVEAPEEDAAATLTAIVPLLVAAVAGAAVLL